MQMSPIEPTSHTDVLQIVFGGSVVFLLLMACFVIWIKYGKQSSKKNKSPANKRSIKGKPVRARASQKKR